MADTTNVRTVDGVRLVHVQDPDLGIVYAEVIVEAGSFFDPPGKEGLAALTANMLLRGTKARTYQQVMDEVNDLGATLEPGAQKELIALTGDFMPRYQDRFSAVLADVLANPTFPKDEFEIERSLVLEDIRNIRNEDAELARHFFARYLYRGHPLGRPTDGYLKSVASLTPRDCADFYRAHLRKGNVIVVLAGTIDDAGADRFVRQVTAAIPAGERERFDVPPPPAGKGVQVLVVDKPDRSQTQVFMGHPSLSWQDPDLFPLLVGNTAFGGTFTSRLMREVREKRGWSYGASSSITAGRVFGTFLVRFFPANKDTAPAITLVQELLGEAATKGLDDKEIAFSRDHLANQFPFRLETVRKRADEKLADLLYERPPRFIEDYVKTVRAQDPAAVNRALAKWYRPQDMVVVIVGTAKDLVADLKKIPGVATVDVVPYTQDEL